MDKSLSLTIVSPDGLIFEGKADKVRLPGVQGSFVVLPMHAPLISQLSSGSVYYTVDGEDKSIVIKSGFVEVKQEIVSICVER